ncbi:MAG: magnesium transporter CorA family protein [Rhodobacterales bacterium]|jgi:magnesium transporter|nr:magnesium transporter CorA family protein [Rhodobacterales bacterium]
MLFSYRLDTNRLVPMPHGDDLHSAIWIDLYRPQPEQAAAVAALGVEVPTLEDMEEIEISNRLYREGANEYMTVVIPGQAVDKSQVSGPVTFILNKDQLVTVRHHAPRPFETFPDRADKASAGCATPLLLFIGLVEEIVSRQADLLEASGKSLDQTAASVFDGKADRNPQLLEEALAAIGREGEVLARVRLGLLTLERMLSVFGLWERGGKGVQSHREHLKGLMRDIQALEVHADFLSTRISLVSDMTMGMINLSQNITIRIVSVVAALFLPPTLIASIYGMNFEFMPELAFVWGYPMALLLMVCSAFFTWAYFKWKGWL